MRQLILNALKAKFQGVSESILGRIADKLCKTVTQEGQVQTAVDGVTLQQVIDGYADSRATEAAQTAVHNYEQKYGLKDGEKSEPKPGGGPDPKPDPKPNGGTEDMPEWAKQLIEANKSLTEKFAKMDAERTTKSRKQQLTEITGKLPENLRKAYERTPVDGLDESQFTTLLSEVTAEVDGILASTKQRGAAFGRPAGNNTGNANPNAKEASEAEAEALADRLRI